jgi:hypothetical protein
MSFKQFINRFQFLVLGIGAVLVVLLFVGWPGGDSAPATTSGAPDTSEG